MQRKVHISAQKALPAVIACGSQIMPECAGSHRI